ncbi:MAG: type VI secretion system baseplate subunit TssF, partial [Phycisphaerales bacterium]|nr:type VI secretion system baseplate subunit TssF [Phycisphaerales bacterium]
MDRKMLEYYETELRYVREAGAEWAERYPRIAGRLGINGTACEDPYVERLFEGLAFLSARVRLKMDSEFPVFTQSLLEAVFPAYLAPTPAMFIARFDPVLGDGSLAAGLTIERGSILRGQISPGEQTPCTFTTAHDVTLWPIRTTGIAYRILGPDQSEMWIDLQTTAELPFSELPLDELTFYARGAGDVPARLLQLLC